MSEEYTNTRVTNPGGRLTEKQKAAWKKRLAAPTRSKNVARRRTRKTRRPSSRSVTRRRRSPARRRRRNTGTAAKATIKKDVYPNLIKVLGLGVGAWFGDRIASWSYSNLISRLPTWAQGPGYLLTGAGVVYGALRLQGKMGKLPIVPVGYGLAAASAIYGIKSMMPAQVAAVVENVPEETPAADTASGMIYGMGGTIDPGSPIGAMGGTIVGYGTESQMAMC